jgi:uncharacterized protein
MTKKLSIFWLIFVSLFIATAPLHAEKQRVAVIGSGGSGLTTTWLLDQDYDVTLYEAEARLGGHANSILVDVDGTQVPIEAGFEFISENQFPHFYNLLKNILKVALHEYTLTTTFYHVDSKDVLSLPPIHDGAVEWESLGPHNIFKMLEFDHLLNSGKQIVNTQDLGITLEDFVNQLTLSSGFKEEFLYPYLAAGWGVTKCDIKKFAAYNALKYVIEGKNAKHFQWIEIVGGTQKYIHALANQLINATVKLSTNITHIYYDNHVYTIVEENGNVSQFDHLVIATNAMQASQLLKDVAEAEDVRTILNQIEYYKTTIAIHGDSRFMPENPDYWRVVNVRYDGENSATTVYKHWLSPSSPVFKSWITYDVRASNDHGSTLPNPLYAVAYYNHPKTNLNYFQSQKALAVIQGNRQLWFAGNYTHDNDSHESAIVSAVNIAKKLAPQSQRLEQLIDINN